MQSTFRNYNVDTVWQTILNLGFAWLEDVCTAKTYTNKPTNWYERIIQRFQEDLATLNEYLPFLELKTLMLAPITSSPL